MARSIWKGAISFGLVHIPVNLVSATAAHGVDFDWLDDRSMEPVGYKRVNKVTGKEVPKEHIVKGVQYEKGRYVVLSEEEIRAAHPDSTQTIDIFAFVEREAIPFTHIDTPYFLSPDRRGEKVYALLRKTLEDTDKVALAHVVLRTKQYLAALMTQDAALVLVMLRWPADVRSPAQLELPSTATKPELAKRELDMAKRLVEDMSADWQPDEYLDSFQDKIMGLVEQKARAGKIEEVEAVEEGEERRSADVIDLTELLKRSLGGKSAPPSKSRKPAAKAKAAPPSDDAPASKPRKTARK
ncbi:Ku protein [Pseudomonas sp. UL073]|uniref:Non-homologous end joining protein Ku n=1 Tax=Zestomonas insulae TaxID=2809017 RepID=A0ABS2IFP9_9GAMM|nr:Ku protein [Pseudomonas insulae]MBM7061909.1 Ku protein [Pseudomonas insulae]